jgi:hypothetical protein
MMMDFSSEFIRGQSDCDKGRSAELNASDAYNRGYSAQYQLEQNKTWNSENEAIRNHRKISASS